MEENYRDDRDYRDDMNYRNYRNYRDDRDYRNHRDYRDYDYRRRDYDRRGGKINNRSYRNYREEDYYEELEMVIEDMREQYRKLEDIAEVSDNSQEKNGIMRIAQKEKENYMYLKQMIEK